MVNVRLAGNASTDRASLDLGKIVHDVTSEFVFVHFTLHEPEPVDANEMEAMETLVNSGQVRTACEGLLFGTQSQQFFFVAEGFQADLATTFQCIVVLRK